MGNSHYKLIADNPEHGEIIDIMTMYHDRGKQNIMYNNVHINKVFYLYLIQKYHNIYVFDCFPSYHTKGMEKYIYILRLHDDKYKTLNTYQINFLDKLTECIILNKNRIIIIQLTYVYKDYDGVLASHAIVLIYRSFNKTIEYYNPDGDLLDVYEVDHIVEMLDEHFIILMDYINKKCISVLGSKIELIKTSSKCPIGLQYLEEHNDVARLDNENERGYCYLWGMFFTELCLLNPSMMGEDIMNVLYYVLNVKSREDSFIAGKYLRHVIRGYSILANQLISNAYLEIKGKEFSIDDFIVKPHKEKDIDLLDIERYIHKKIADKIIIEPPTGRQISFYVPKFLQFPSLFRALEQSMYGHAHGGRKTKKKKNKKRGSKNHTEFIKLKKTMNRKIKLK